MLAFSKDFFKGEIRDDYYIKPLEKRHRAALLEMLVVIDSVCRKYGIRYFADGGTLLGAVRHKGFIPWDDDFDIAMLREDYQRFLEIAPIEFNHYEVRPEALDREGKLYFHSAFSSKEQMLIQSMISNSRTITFDHSHLMKYHGYPLVAAIDIFVIDYFPGDDNEEAGILLDLLNAAVTLVSCSDNWNEKGDPVDDNAWEAVNKIVSMVGYSINGNAPVRLQMNRFLNTLCSVYRRDECEYMQNILWYAIHRDECTLFKKNWYDKTIYLPFETIDVPCPADYDGVLRALYGDYETPVDYGGHGAKQEKILEGQNIFKGEDWEKELEEFVSKYD